MKYNDALLGRHSTTAELVTLVRLAGASGLSRLCTVQAPEGAVLK